MYVWNNSTAVFPVNKAIQCFTSKFAYIKIEFLFTFKQDISTLYVT